MPEGKCREIQGKYRHVTVETVIGVMHLQVQILRNASKHDNLEVT